MKIKLCLWLALIGAALVVTARGQEESFDRNRLRELYQRSQRGEKLTSDEQSYLDRGKASFQRQNANRQNQGGAALPPPRESTGMVPLTELGSEKYKGEDGGLYGGGKNEPPAAHAEAARKLAAQVQPLDAEGKPAKDGKIGVMSVGMSNTTMEFSAFKRMADADPQKSPRVTIVDCAQGGKTGKIWADANSPVWQEAENRMKRAEVSPLQIQVVWLKQAEAGPATLGDFPAHAKNLQSHLAAIVNHLKTKYPNVRLVYLSSRIYAGYATTQLNPEPYSYESAFAVRWLIQDQIAGKPELNCDAANGEVKAPLLLWGPYLWGDGMKPRKSDGLVWERKDLAERDGTHPSDPSGRDKVAKLLLDFMKHDATAKAWFMRPAATAKN